MTFVGHHKKLLREACDIYRIEAIEASECKCDSIVNSISAIQVPHTTKFEQFLF